MDDFPSLLNFGVRPQGKADPMAASRGTTNLNNGIGSGGIDASSSSRSAWNSYPSNSFRNDGIFGGGGGGGGGNHRMNKDYDDVFGGPPKYTTPPPAAAERSSTSFDFDSMFPSGSSSTTAQASVNPSNARNNNNNNYGSSPPVYDKPVYDDDDIFEGIPGLTAASSTKYGDLFSSVTSPPNQGGAGPLFEDLLGNLGKAEPQFNKNNSGKSDTEPGFDDLFSSFGATSPPKDRGTSETNQAQQSTASSTNATSSGVINDPFEEFASTSSPVYASSGLFSDPLEQNSKPSNIGSSKVNTSSVGGGIFDDVDPLAGLGKSGPSFSSDMRDIMKDRSHQKVDISPKSEENLEAAADEIWLTVSEVPLFTQPTSAPPPSRPPPPRPSQFSSEMRFASSKKVNEFSSQHFTQNWQSPKGGPDSAKIPVVSSIDEFEDFAMGKPSNNHDERGDALSSDEELEKNSAASASAAAMKDAMDRAEAKFKHAKEVRERENAKAGRIRVPGQQERDDKATQDAQECELREKQERLDNEREQREREQRQLEKERERAREDERNREKVSARQAVERATREARDRAGVEARQKAERATVQRAQAEVRERAERAAVQKALNEARERAAVQRAQAEVRERAERAAVQKAQNEARERLAAQAAARAQSEAKEKAAAVARAEADVRHRAERTSVDRATAEARERASAAARESQQKNENDLESFFGMGSRPSSAPKARTTTSNSSFDAHQNKAGPEVPPRSSSGTSSSIRKASSATNMTDDLSSIFGAASSSRDFQEIDGESYDRRKARMERYQKTQERVLNALAEKNERDLQNQREQAERHRIAETLDVKIRLWAAGKETNLRALLSTLQYVLWPECGWQPVSLTDLITGASVKKVYRKATLCVHPDKVQQKGANLPQKYIAEKVFDLLKEAWNKFNSEELF